MEISLAACMDTLHRHRPDIDLTVTMINQADPDKSEKWGELARPICLAHSHCCAVCSDTLACAAACHYFRPDYPKICRQSFKPVADLTLESGFLHSAPSPRVHKHLLFRIQIERVVRAPLASTAILEPA